MVKGSHMSEEARAKMREHSARKKNCPNSCEKKAVKLRFVT